MTLQNVGLKVTCNSNCFQWCPRRLKIRCCCLDAEDSDSEESQSTEEKADEVAKEALRVQEEDRKKKSCCTIL